MVVARQYYEHVVRLDRHHSIFNAVSYDDNDCAGAFYMLSKSGIAVSGTGSNIWYKISPELIAFCRAVDARACAMTTAQLRFMKCTDAICSVHTALDSLNGRLDGCMVEINECVQHAAD
eukprot:1310137-Prymnesium_polylepis.1